MRWFSRFGLLAFGLLMTGCNSGTAEPAGKAAAEAGVSARGEELASPSVPKVEGAAAGTPLAEATALFAKIEAALEAGVVEQAVQSLQEAEMLGGQLEEKDRGRLEVLRAQVRDRMSEQTALRRIELLRAAEASVAGGQFEQATRQIEDVLKNSPNDDERRSVEALRKQIEDQHRRQRELAIAMQLLSSDKATDLRGARTRLAADLDGAIPLVVAAIAGDDSRLAANAIDVLRSFNAPEKTLPILVGVLSKPEQSRHWSAAIRELTRAAAPGAGPGLLALAAKTTDASHRQAVLAALAGVVDPPPETVASLVPMVFQDSDELAAVLSALQHAVTVNGQEDLLSLRGIPEGAASPEFERLLADLPGRLEALAKVTPATDTSRAALSLGIVTRLLAPQVLADVNVLRASAEAADSSAKSAVDGVWTSVEIKSMFRHPSDKPVTLVLDLGAERTVAGVKIWNHNEAGGRHRGWKDVDVFVSNTPASLTATPSARGVVPMAPGTADPPDYGSVIPVPCHRGRYIRLEARNYWQPDGTAGIAEVQVLGY